MYNKRIIISENERNNILSLYNGNVSKRDYIFELCSSIDGRYFILKDEVFDNKSKNSLGNLWESIDIFKTIFKNVKIENPEYQTIKESILSIPLLESENNLKHIKKFLLEWSFLDKSWLNEEINNDSFTNKIFQSWENLKRYGIEIPQNNWKEILTQLFKGVKFVIRTLKNALYSDAGMLVDAILVATGIGKGVQMFAWGLVVALDIYQLSSNDYGQEEASDPYWAKILGLGFDILALASTGALAKPFIKIVQYLKKLKIEQAITYIRQNQKISNIIQTILSKLDTVPSYLNKIKTTIANKSPKITQFINDAIAKYSQIVEKIKTTLNGLIGEQNTDNILKGSKKVALNYVSDKIEMGLRDRLNTSTK